ncbi:hypothetical protein FJZ55_07780 [Candidatus Woesearchaeota archaeon]|nr:hypothetical protein [Candidatus Woesearchaeota archaeon]
MPFQPTPNFTFEIEGIPHRVAEHPAAPGVAYGQEGRAATVYQLHTADNTLWALKVFRPRFRVPALVGLADTLAGFANIPGLSACRRTVLTSRKHTELLRQYPDLTYAVLMPWIDGPTWMQVVLEQQPFTPEQSLRLARALLHLLAEMEECGLAHCDLSGPNLILPALAANRSATTGADVALVDVEQMFGPGLNKPEILPGGTAGYAHKIAPTGLWSVNTDRFAGAVLLAEILGWCDERVRRSAAGESYFTPEEIQKEDSDRGRLLSRSLHDYWGAATATLFENAWRSATLEDCATFGDWLVALPTEAPAVRATQEKRTHNDLRPGRENTEVSQIAMAINAPSPTKLLKYATTPTDAVSAYPRPAGIPVQDAGVARWRPVIASDAPPPAPIHSPLGCGVQVLWLVAHAVGALIAYGTGWALIWGIQLTPVTLPILAFIYVGLSFASGGITSLIQRLTLRHFAKRIRWWVLGNAAVWTGMSLLEVTISPVIAFIATFVSVTLDRDSVIYPIFLLGAFVAHGILKGLLTGIVQVVSLRTQVKTKIRWFVLPIVAWMLSSTCAGFTSLVTSFALDSVLNNLLLAQTIAIFLGWSVGGAIVGLISSLIWRDIRNSLLTL